jgi:hypothetical protein
VRYIARRLLRNCLAADGVRALLELRAWDGRRRWEGGEEEGDEEELAVRYGSSDCGDKGVVAGELVRETEREEVRLWIPPLDRDLRCCCEGRV